MIMITNALIIVLPVILIVGYVLHHAGKYPKYKQVRWMIISIVGEHWTGIYDYETMYQYDEAFQEVRTKFKLTSEQFDMCLTHLYDETWFKTQSFLKDAS
jgi:predicted nucleotide-binding protein (sugar kinase/HSP70/actin superfamily)